MGSRDNSTADAPRGLIEAILSSASDAIIATDADGRITEGPGFNVFALIDGSFVTPDRGVLEGVTRRAVLDIAVDQGIPARLGAITIDDLRRADEAFLTSTAGGVMPVVSIDGRVLGDGRPGPLTTRLRDAYWAAHDDPRWATSIDYDAAR